jgi:hypothetical protein
LKQDILDGANKLPIASVDLTGSTLVNSDYTSSVTTKFAAIDTTLASQATLNSTTATNISDLSTNKQNVLNGTNKLNPSFIDANGLSLTTTKMGYLSSITSDLQTQLDNLGGASTTATLDDLTVKRITEKIDAAIVSFTANVLTVDISTSPNILYMDDLTSNTNFRVALTNSPNGTYRCYTFTLWIDTSLYKAYADTVSINGTVKTVLFNGGASAIDISAANNTTMLVQQITVFYLLSASIPDKVISNITLFKA